MKMPRVGLGTWKAQDPKKLMDAVRYALEVGYRHLDCAPIYMNEQPVGQAFSDACRAGVVAREACWITSKLWNSFHHPDDVQPALEATLRYMKLDYLDLFLMHWPVALSRDLGYKPFDRPEDLVPLDAMPLEKTWEAMLALKEKGLVRHVGVSNFSIKHLNTLKQAGLPLPFMNQIECHLYLQQHELRAFCQKEGIDVTAYSPLGSVDRPAKLKAQDEPVLLQDPVVLHWAEQCNMTPAQVALAWLLHEGCAVIPKSVTPERIASNFEASTCSLPEAALTALRHLDCGRRYVLGDFFTMPGSPYTLDALWG
jgi:alcohol dehydrogenase (NADP+)